MNDADPPDRPVAAASAAGEPVMPPALRRSWWAGAWQRIQRLKGPIVAFAAVGTVLGGLAGWWNSYRTVRSGVSPTVASAPTSPVKPYSAADRRMTFAVLPFHAPTGDFEATGIAQSAFDSAQALQEARTTWARVTPRAMAAQAAASPATLRQLGQTLDVHFLLRGNVTRTAAGFALDLAVLDADSESPLATRTIAAVDEGGVMRIPRDTLDFSLGWLTFAALKHEVARARTKLDSQLDVRDLSFRAYVDWRDANTDQVEVYAKVRQSLDRALAMAPDDPLTLQITAEINLCECLRAWAPDTTEMEQIGEAALNRYLGINPESLRMLELRALLLLKRGRAEDALLLVDHVLERGPDRWAATELRVSALFQLGRAEEALAAVPAMLKVSDNPMRQAIAAAVYFESGDDAAASQMARKALVQMTPAERADALSGVVALVLVAAESRAGEVDRARAALKDFHTAVPQAQTIAQIKAWRLPHAVLPGSEAFWQALQRVGVR